MNKRKVVTRNKISIKYAVIAGGVYLLELIILPIALSTQHIRQSDEAITAWLIFIGLLIPALVIAYRLAGDAMNVFVRYMGTFLIAALIAFPGILAIILLRWAASV